MAISSYVSFSHMQCWWKNHKTALCLLGHLLITFANSSGPDQVQQNIMPNLWQADGILEKLFFQKIDLKACKHQKLHEPI